MIRIGRRSVLATGLAWMAAPGQAQPGGVVTTELVLTETALALGLTPAAVGNRGLYRRLVGDPALPGSSADLGPLNEPNLELLRHLRPGLILAAAWQEASQGRLNRIAPTVWLQTLPVDGALANARRLTLEIAAATGRDAAGARLLARLDDAIGRAREGTAPQRVLVVRFLEDGRHMIVFGPGSLPGDILAAFGTENAAGARSMVWGARHAGVEELMADPGALILSIAGPAGEAAAERVFSGPLFRAVMAGARSRLRHLPPVFPAGGAHTAARLAEAIGAQLGTRG